MKKYLQLISRKIQSYLTLTGITAAIILTFSTCQKAPINGDLDGQWEVMQVTPSPETVIIPERLFYNFSLQVCDLTYYGALFTQGNMEFTGETLWLEFPFADNSEKKSILRQYGILSDPVSFKVNFIDKRHLILSNEESEVVLVKH